MTKFSIDIYADTVCPWCYINKKSLDAAIVQHRSLHPDDEFHLVWRPYILYPNAKVSAYSKKDAYYAKFGADMPKVIERARIAAQPFGVTFSSEGRTGCSRDSHKLILLAADFDNKHAATPSTSTTNSSSFSSSSANPPTSVSVSATSRSSSPVSPASPPTGPCVSAASSDIVDPRPESVAPPNYNHHPVSSGPSMPPTSAGTGTRWESLLATLLSGTLTQGADISDRSFLIPVALSHGLASSAEEVEAYLDSPAANARVDEETARARTEVGVAAVPSVVVNGRYRVGGMQEPGVFLGLFERIRVK